MPQHHVVENVEVARVFNELADLLEIEGANPFRVRAYRTAARTVAELPHSVDALVRSNGRALTELPGIGKDLAGKIEEIVRTGTLSALASAEREAPKGVLALVRLPGLGPKRARTLCEQLGVRSLDDLRRAAERGRVRTLPGFGAKTEARILESLAHHAAGGERVLRSVAAQYGEALLAYMRGVPGIGYAELAGSFRRCKETVGDLDLLVTCRPSARAIEQFVAYPEVETVLARGTTRASVRLRSGLQVDLRVLPAASYGAALHYFTGSKAHNIAVRRLGQQRGLKINEYGIFRGTRRIGGREEQEVFDAVGLPWIPPELREDRGELEAARAGTLPSLITLDDIRGDLQCHTTDSDGRDTLEAMAAAAEAVGYEYLAITDHTPTVRIAGGLDRAGFRAQRRRIDTLNAKLRSLTLLAGAEVDIHADGRLDLDDATLAGLDLVIVALHTKLDLSPAEQTRRVLRALAHESVDLFAHPTSRLLRGRKGATFDLDAVIAAAADHGVMLEIDAQPERLDLDDVAARAAAERNVMLAVDTDAHATSELGFMRWGIDQARRAWVTRRSVANTRTLDRLLPLLHRGRR
jgi:DNA polymerase (family 10)